MSYGLKYRCQFTNAQSEDCEIQLLANGFDGDLIDIEGADSAFTTRNTDTDEDKFKPIRGQEATIRVIADENINLENLITDDDEYWRVQFYKSGLLIWVGFLSFDDCSQELQDTPFVLELKATDGLGFLKSKQLRASDDSIMSGKYSPVYLIQTCLEKTKLGALVNIYANIYGDGMTSRPSGGVNCPMNQCTIDVYTFQQDHSTFDDCYKVLEKICEAWGMVIFQALGEWHCVRVNERQWDSLSGTKYTSIPTIQSDVSTPIVDQITEVRFDAFINGDAPIVAVNVDQRLSIQRPYKYDKLIYNWVTPNPIIKNIDLQDGTFSAPNSSPGDTAYVPSDWTQTGRTAYIHVLTDVNDKETERYMAIAGAADYGDPAKYISTTSIPVTAGDRIKNFSIRFRAKTNTSPSGSEAFPITFKLVGASTTYYITNWGVTPDNKIGWGTIPESVLIYWGTGVDNSQWKEFSFPYEVETFPADGDLQLDFYLFQGCGVGNETWFQDIVFDYEYLNGQTGVIGEFWKQNKDAEIKNTFEKEVYISDAKRGFIKGGMFQNDGTFTGLWYRNGVVEERDFLEQNSLSYYNAFKTFSYKIEGSFYGLNYLNGDDQLPISLLNLFYLNNFNSHAFMATNLEVDYHTCIWRGSLIELPAGGTDNGDSSEFKYIY